MELSKNIFCRKIGTSRNSADASTAKATAVRRQNVCGTVRVEWSTNWDEIFLLLFAVFVLKFYTLCSSINFSVRHNHPDKTEIRWKFQHLSFWEFFSLQSSADSQECKMSWLHRGSAWGRLGLPHLLETFSSSRALILPVEFLRLGRGFCWHFLPGGFTQCQSSSEQCSHSKHDCGLRLSNLRHWARVLYVLSFLISLVCEHFVDLCRISCSFDAQFRGVTVEENQLVLQQRLQLRLLEITCAGEFCTEATDEIKVEPLGDSFSSLSI